MDLRPYIEHTNLNPQITYTQVEELLQEGLDNEFFGVCLPPFWVKKAARDLSGKSLKLITVAGFPLGYSMTETKLAEIDRALNDGSDEVDVVMNISAFKSGMPWVKIELAKCSKLVHEAEKILKVIIETAYLESSEIELACKLCEDAGADYVKTSTGLASRGASTEDIELMRKVLTSKVGIKASGGIKDRKFAELLIQAGADRLGTSSGTKLVSTP